MDHLRHSLFACVCVGLLGLIAGQLTSVSILIAANIGAIYALIWLAIPVSFSQTPREKQDLYRTLALSTRGFDFGVTVALLLIPAFFLGRYLFCLSDDLSTMIVFLSWIFIESVRKTNRYRQPNKRVNSTNICSY